MKRCDGCGMVCDLKDELKIEEKGQTYCFCSKECKKKFEKERLEKIEKGLVKEYRKHAKTLREL